MNNLAEVLSRQDKYEQVEEMYREPLRLYQRVLGKEYPHTLMSNENPGVSVESSGQE